MYPLLRFRHTGDRIYNPYNVFGLPGAQTCNPYCVFWTGGATNVTPVTFSGPRGR